MGSDRPPGSGRARVSDVAAAAGVSTTTVSHALSGARTVNAATRERILQVARELGYVPDRVASGLRRRRTGVVALIGDDLAATPFAGRIIEGARRAGLERDVLLMVGESGGDAEVEADLVARFLAQRVDGLLIARMYHQQVERPAVPDGFPVVLVDAAPESGWEVDAVVPNEAQIAALACERLLSAGHRDIAYIGTTESRAARGRLAGVRSVLGDAGIALGDGRLAFCYADAAGGRQAGGRAARPGAASDRDHLLQRPDRDGRHAGRGAARHRPSPRDCRSWASTTCIRSPTPSTRA